MGKNKERSTNGLRDVELVFEELKDQENKARRDAWLKAQAEKKNPTRKEVTSMNPAVEEKPTDEEKDDKAQGDINPEDFDNDDADTDNE